MHQSPTVLRPGNKGGDPIKQGGPSLPTRRGACCSLFRSCCKAGSLQSAARASRSSELWRQVCGGVRSTLHARADKLQQYWAGTWTLSTSEQPNNPRTRCGHAQAEAGTSGGVEAVRHPHAGRRRFASGRPTLCLALTRNVLAYDVVPGSPILELPGKHFALPALKPMGALREYMGLMCQPSCDLSAWRHRQGVYVRASR